MDIAIHNSNYNGKNVQFWLKSTKKNILNNHSVNFNFSTQVVGYSNDLITYYYETELKSGYFSYDQNNSLSLPYPIFSYSPNSTNNLIKVKFTISSDFFLLKNMILFWYSYNISNSYQNLLLELISPIILILILINYFYNIKFNSEPQFLFLILGFFGFLSSFPFSFFFYY